MLFSSHLFLSIDLVVPDLDVVFSPLSFFLVGFCFFASFSSPFVFFLVVFASSSLFVFLLVVFGVLVKSCEEESGNFVESFASLFDSVLGCGDSVG
jgi:hypothetical protein